MLKFFRKISHNLINEGKTVKYFKYAFGEIFLILIGILVSLQINNRNDARKQIKKERELLQQFIIALKDGLLMLHGTITYNNFVTKSCDVIINHLEGNLPYHDSLSIYFDSWASIEVLEFNMSSHQNLITTGPELIRNEILKNL